MEQEKFKQAASLQIQIEFTEREIESIEKILDAIQEKEVSRIEIGDGYFTPKKLMSDGCGNELAREIYFNNTTRFIEMTISDLKKLKGKLETQFENL